MASPFRTSRSRWHRHLGHFVDWLAVVASSRPLGSPVSSTRHRHSRFLTRPRLCDATESSKLIAPSTLPICRSRGAEGMPVRPAFLTRTFAVCSFYLRSRNCILSATRDFWLTGIADGFWEGLSSSVKPKVEWCLFYRGR